MHAHIMRMTNESEQGSIERMLREKEEGSIGIGAMIVFIALILVAAVASTIIIKTAEELQQRAEKTADDTKGEISGKVSIVDALVNEVTGSDVTSILLIAQLAAGADEVTSDQITYFITCSDGTNVAIDTNDIDSAAGALLDDTALDSTALEAGVSFKVPLTLTNCGSAVGSKIQILIVVEGGGETEAELEVTSLTIGKSLV